MTKRPIVIDCDPGVDDTLAILLAASCPELDMRAINPVAGNVGYALTSENALRLREFIGLDCRIGRGAQRPLIVPFEDAGDIHGKGGLGGYQLPEATRGFDDAYAWDVLYEEAQRAGGALELVTLGPLTNVAIALMRHPDLAGMIKKITMMAGTAGQGNTNVYAEFNVRVDPHACDLVLRSGIPLALCGLDGNESCRLDGEELFRVFEQPSRVTPLTSHIAHYTHERNVVKWGLKGSTINDLVTMACFIDPSIASYEPCYTVCETRSSLSLGQTLIDLYHVSHQPPNADILLRADKGRYLQMIEGMMRWYAAH